MALGLDGMSIVFWVRKNILRFEFPSWSKDLLSFGDDAVNVAEQKSGELVELAAVLDDLLSQV